jgi:hypothetical protein
MDASATIVGKVSSSAVRPANVRQRDRQRSRITNGSALLPGVDGRSAWIRRCEDVIEAHLSDLGGEPERSRWPLDADANVKNALEWARKARTTSPEGFIALCIEHGFTVFKDEGYDVFAIVAEEDRADWYLFGWFLIVNEGAKVEGGGLFEHIEWTLQKQFKTVEEWLGPEGDRFRGRRPMGERFKKLWRAFQAEHAALTIPEIEAEIMKLADYQREHPQPKKRGRR